MTSPRPPRSSSLDDASPEAAKASLERHRALWSDATVVGVGATARSVRELHILAHGLVRLLVVELGFRAVVIEGDRAASEQLDTFVREGTGDPRSILARSRPFLRSEEMLSLVRWLRRCNERDPALGLRLVHGGADDLSSPAALERSIAGEVLSWHDRTAHRIIYLGGAAHTAVTPARSDRSGSADPVLAAGSILRERFGARYCSVGLTFGSGAIPQTVPNPAPGFLEARLDELPHPALLVPTEEFDDEHSRQWLAGADRLRIVGPGYDTVDDSRHHMAGDATAWFDVIIHRKVGSSINFLKARP